MAVKKSFVTEDLDWAETQLKSWKEYVDAHPFNSLTDRIEWKSTKTGGMMPMVIASIEAQGKFIQETMKNYLGLLEVVDRLREKEEVKKQIRGDEDLSPMEGGLLEDEE
jgi:hypothetical protein